MLRQDARGAGMTGRVADWRATAKGAHHWLDTAAEIERRMQAVVADAAKTSPIDAAQSTTHADELERLLIEMDRLATNVQAESRLLTEWIGSQTSGLLGRLAAGDFRAQFDEQFEIYGMLIEGMPDSLDFYRQKLAAIAPTTDDGLTRCPRGHENHPSRKTCLTCDSPLNT